jgi:FkbM family methyltransferase
MALQVMRPEEFVPHMFHENLLEDLFSNLDEYELLADSLADNYSREVLAGVLKYRLTCDPLCLEDIIEWDLYGPNDLVNYSNNETYIDAGAFDGDSIKLFIDRVNGKYHKIIGFEPDPATFQDLKNNLNNHTDIDLINAGLYDSNQILKFNDAGTRGSIISEDGDIEIKVTSIDNVLNGEKVSYIKLNIEGSELKALDGAKRSISEWEPKLAISAYHEADHLWKISKKINELSANYKLYLRQHDGGIIETVTFGIPR